MATMSHVYTRETGVREFRRLIPERLRPAFGGKRWFIESLHTKDASVAKARAAEVAMRFNARVEQAERALLGQTGQEWFHTEDERYRVERTKPHRRLSPLVSRWGLNDGITVGDLRNSLTEFLKEHPNGTSPGTIEFDRLLETVRGIYDYEYGLRQDEPIAPVVGPTPQPQPARIKSLTMNDLIQAWARETAPVERTTYTWKRIAAKLTRHVGMDDVTRISRGHILSWKEALLQSGLSRKTVVNYLTAINTLLGWGERNGKLAMNPARGVTLKTKKKSAIRGYTDDEARQFCSLLGRSVKLISAGCHGWRASPAPDWKKYAAPLCVMCGRSEVHIRLDHRGEHGGLKLDEDSERIIPLHGAIIAEGFMDYVRKLPVNGPLFPHIKPDMFGRRGGTGSKALGRWVRHHVGITDERIAPNHSWRHRFKTLCRNIHMREDVEEYLTSHAEGSSSGRRYGEHEVEALASVIALIRSPLEPRS
jgi:integrase